MEWYKIVAVAFCIFVLVMDYKELVKHWNDGNDTPFIPGWLRKMIPFIVSLSGYGIIIYAILN